MTVVAIMAGLLPIMWGAGTGSEVMRRIAVPMVGGMVSATVLTLIVIPAVYARGGRRCREQVGGHHHAIAALQFLVKELHNRIRYDGLVPCFHNHVAPWLRVVTLLVDLSRRQHSG